MNTSKLRTVESQVESYNNSIMFFFTFIVECEEVTTGRPTITSNDEWWFLPLLSVLVWCSCTTHRSNIAEHHRRRITKLSCEHVMLQLRRRYSQTTTARRHTTLRWFDKKKTYHIFAIFSLTNILTRILTSHLKRVQKHYKTDESEGIVSQFEFEFSKSCNGVQSMKVNKRCCWFVWNLVNFENEKIDETLSEKKLQSIWW